MQLLSSLLLLSLLTPYPHRTESFSLMSLLQPRRRPNRHYCNDINQHGAISLSQSATSDVAEYVGSEIGAELQQQQNVLDLSINDDDDEEGILAALFGSAETRDHFFKHMFGRRVAYFPRSKGLTMHEANNQQQLEPPISGIDLPSLYETNEWTSLRKRGSQDMLDKSQMSYSSLTEYISGGGSIVIPITPDDYLFSTKLQFERAFGVKEETGTTINVYHSGPSAVALNIHYDAWPVFVLQLEGKKEWIIQEDAFGLPKSQITEWKNITMTEGDLLYIPQGVFHAATTAEGYSTTTHTTIGLL